MGAISYQKIFASALTVRPVVDTDHTWGWPLCGLAAPDLAQHRLAAARKAMPRELADARRPAKSQAGVTLGLADPRGGVGIWTCYGRHPLGEGAPATEGGIAKKAPDVEVEVHRDRGPG